MKTYLLDPASTEWNRGGYNYLPYLFYDYLKWEEGRDVTFIENFTVLDLNKIDTSGDHEIYVSFCTPPQKDMCLELHRLYPQANFLGYYGFIEELGFPMFRVSSEQIVSGMKHQGKSFSHLKTILLSDCDAHINGKFEGSLYPIHTSYACSNGCFFCPGSKNNCRRMDYLPLANVAAKLQFFHNHGWNNLHFVDENMAVNNERMHEVLTIGKKIGNFNSIILGDSVNLLKFIHRYGETFLQEHGVFLLEIGFEGSNLLDTKGGNKHVKACEELYRICPDLTFFLTITFSPGETIETLNRTGEWLRNYGKKPEELMERIRTNGTEGGLGQFFQPYPDLPYDAAGLHSPFNPTRLYPSFIPASFLNSQILAYASDRWDDFVSSCSLYPVRPEITSFPRWVGRTVIDILGQYPTYIERAEIAIMIAIAARLRIIF